MSTNHVSNLFKLFWSTDTALAALLGLGTATCFAQEAAVSPYQEHGKLIRAPRAVAHLGADLFGDKVNLYTGALEFVQTDVRLPGNNALPVSIARRLVTGQRSGDTSHFGRWELEIPHMHGIFAFSTGWQAQLVQDPNTRCTNFGLPPGATGSGQSSWNATEFWHGNFLYVPGMGDQEMLRRSPANTQAPGANVAAYPVVTRNNWAIRCLPSLAPGNNALGEGFIAVAPDGTEYRFDWLVRRPATALAKASSLAESARSTPTVAMAQMTESDTGRDGNSQVIDVGETPNIVDGNVLRRVEVWIMPTTVTDRFGNTVTYTYDTSNQWQLKSIVSNDAPGSPRSLTINYVNPGQLNSNSIASVFDGSRTWTYGYVSAEGLPTLATVTLPDGSSWKELDALFPLLADVQYSGLSGDCESPGSLAMLRLTGHLVHPSGARGEFVLEPRRHGRSGVERRCIGDAIAKTEVPYYPKIFDTNALISKTISGPGIAPMQWLSAYAAEASSWGACNGCNAATQVSVSDPSGASQRYTFGTLFRINEGQLQQTEVIDASGNVLRSTAQQYIEPIAPLGISDQRRGDGEMAARVSEVNHRAISQQGVDFTWHANTFDEYAKPTQVVRQSALGSRTENTSYDSNTSKWVLSQIRQVTEANSGKVMVLNQYNASSALLESVSRFGLTQQSMTYNADGTVLTKSDGLGHATRFVNYMRGLPRNVIYPDNSSESAEINNDGTIAAVIDAVNLRTSYSYDDGGRLSQISYPVAPGDPSWNATTMTFRQFNSDEYGVSAGHWRQDISHGNLSTSIVMDALWRPVYNITYDVANVGGSLSTVMNRYDHAGRTTFTSYPASQASNSGVTTEYDALGRVTQVLTASELGTLGSQKYYNGGFQTTVRDNRGNSSTTGYQAFDTPSEDAIASIVAPEGLNVAISRDVFGKPTAITRSGNGASATRSYTYDGFERLCKTIEPETGATLQLLDAAGNVSWRAAGTGLTSATCDWGSVAPSDRIVFDYDAMNRLKTTTYGDNSAGIIRTYLADGQPSTVTSSGAVWSMNYNGRRLPTSQSLAFEGQTYTITNVYDANGNLAQLNYPSATNAIANQSVAYGPDALGRPSHVGGYASGISYHASGAVAGFTYGNGKVRTMTPNLRNLPALAQDGGVLQDVYSYDANGNVTAITDQINAGPNGANTSRTMGYDGLDRLTAANSPGIWGSATYSYDVLDNFRTSAIGGRVNTYRYSARNLLDNVQSTASGFTLNYAYDNRGNATWRNDQNFGFDLANRMGASAYLDSYIYDGFGRRIKTAAVDGTVTISVYSPAGQLLYTRRTGGPNPPRSTQYIYLHNHQIAEVTK